MILKFRQAVLSRVFQIFLLFFDFFHFFSFFFLFSGLFNEISLFLSRFCRYGQCAGYTIQKTPTEEKTKKKCAAFLKE